MRHNALMGVIAIASCGGVLTSTMLSPVARIRHHGGDRSFSRSHSQSLAAAVAADYVGQDSEEALAVIPLSSPKVQLLLASFHEDSGSPPDGSSPFAPPSGPGLGGSFPLNGRGSSRSADPAAPPGAPPVAPPAPDTPAPDTPAPDTPPALPVLTPAGGAFLPITLVTPPPPPPPGPPPPDQPPPPPPSPGPPVILIVEGPGPLPGPLPPPPPTIEGRAVPPTVTAVPEPASWLTLLMGFTAVAAALRRRRITIKEAA